jgi:hypothetical protein
LATTAKSAKSAAAFDDAPLFPAAAALDDSMSVIDRLLADIAGEVADHAA